MIETLLDIKLLKLDWSICTALFNSFMFNVRISYLLKTPENFHYLPPENVRGLKWYKMGGIK